VLVFSADRRHLATVGKGASVLVWDLARAARRANQKPK
jgi:hypothetical protein